MSIAEKIKLSAHDYLKGEETSEFKHEYIDGDVWAMAGASDTHVTIAMNLAFLLRQKLKDSPCRSYISDMKVRVEQVNAFFYPDVFVTCEQKDKKNSHYKEHPVFIAEVLSPSTEAYDRGDKFKNYRQLASLQEYWLIDAQTLSVDCFTRQNDDAWILRNYSLAKETSTIPSLNINLSIAEIYEDTNM